MKNITIYEVTTGGNPSEIRLVSNLRLSTLDKNAAEVHARAIYAAEGVIPDIMAGDWLPTDHTTPEMLKEKAKRTKRSQMFWNNLVAGATAIRHARTPENAPQS